MDISSIIGAVTSVASGGITGLFGTAIGAVFQYKSKQLDVELQKEKYANEIELKKADAAILQQEWTARTAIAATTADAEKDAEASKAFSAALTSEPQRYAEGALTTGQNWLMVLLDLLRGFIRPAITLYLAGITTLVYLQAHALIGTAMPIDQATVLTNKVIDTVLYLTTTSVLFYFGQRHLDKTK